MGPNPLDHFRRVWTIIHQITQDPKFGIGFCERGEGLKISMQVGNDDDLHIAFDQCLPNAPRVLPKGLGDDACFDRQQCLTGQQEGVLSLVISGAA